MISMNRRFGWPGRFADVASVAVNFYSTGDEVLELAADNDLNVLTGVTGSLSHHAWHKQELFKGRGMIDGLGGTTWSGWNVEENMFGVAKISVEEARQMTDADFRTNTVFFCYPASMNATNISLLVRAAHLAKGIPALTPAAGATAFAVKELLDEMIDLNAISSFGVEKPNGWPTRSSYPSRWLHSDIKALPYFYSYKFYELVVEKGNLK